MKLPASPRLPRLPLAEVPRTVAAFFVAAVVEVGLRTMSLPRLADLVGAPLLLGPADPSAAPAPEVDAGSTLPPDARRQVAATRRVLRHWPFGDTCLRQALVSGAGLRRLRPRLQVGVAKLDGDVRAHAWLLVRGRVLDPLGAASSYLPLNSIPPELRG